MLPSFNSSPGATWRDAHVVKECQIRLEHLKKKKKHFAKLNRMMTCFQCYPKLSSNLSIANFATTVVE